LLFKRSPTIPGVQQLGKRGPKPQFLDIVCPNENRSLFGVAGKGNITVCGTYKEVQAKTGSSFVIPVELRSAIELTRRFMI